MKLTSLRCPNCGANLNIKKISIDNGNLAHCTYCGSAFVLEKEQTPPPAPRRHTPAPSVPRRKSGGLAAFLVLLILIGSASAFVLIPYFKSQDTTTAPPTASVTTLPETEVLQTFLAQALGKDYKLIKPADIDALRYLDIKVGDERSRMDIWVFTYSLEDPDESPETFADSLQTITFSRDTNDHIEWKDFQCFTGLIHLNLNSSTYISSYGSGDDLKMLSQLRYYNGPSSQDASEVAELLADPEQIVSLGTGLRSAADLEALSAFKNLEELDIHYVFGDDASGGRLEGMSALAGLKKLTKLKLRSCNDISWLSSLTALKDVTIESGEGINDFSVFYGMPGIESLSLIRLSIKDLGFAAAMPKLSRLSIEGSEIRSLEGLAGKTSLTELLLDSNSELNDITALETLTSLKKLAVIAYSLDGSNISLTGLELLEDVTLHYNLLPLLGNSSSIRKLSTWQIITEPVDCSVFLQFPALSELSILDGNKLINAEALSGLENLQSININDCSLLESQVFTALFTLPGLQSLSFSDMLLTIESGTLPPSPSLETFRIGPSVTWRYTENGEVIEANGDATAFTRVFEQMPQLRVVELQETGLTDLSSFKELINLEYLNVKNNYIKDVSPVAKLPALKYLNIDDNPVENMDILKAE